ncbi:hypothetical protein PS907_00169 [Pseudomonas fluorescens]|nr:hypothetical protein PS907_00169 [Pseudomonas fluorescens]
MATKKSSLTKYKASLVEASCEIDQIYNDYELGFVHEKLNYILRVDKDDDGFVEIILPYELDGEPDFSKRYEVCNHIAKTYKLVKCFYVEDGVYVSVETFVKSVEDFKRVLQYSLISLDVAYTDAVTNFPDGV